MHGQRTTPHGVGQLFLAALAGLEPASVICEILKDDGTMARLPDLVEFAKTHGLKIGAIRDLIEYRSSNEHLIERVADKEVETSHGRFRLCAFEDKTTGEVHFSLSRGDIKPENETLVRVHEPISIVDFIDPENGRHSFPVNDALAQIAQSEQGVIVLLYRPQPGHELLAGLRGDGVQPAKWDARLFGVGAQILRDLNVGKMRLMASPRKIPSMAGFGLEITGFVEPA
jgi:3,4-dihydroxy 2-butanone 4-phosphate synthase/GTP cyclohydrolase II